MRMWLLVRVHRPSRKDVAALGVAIAALVSIGTGLALAAVRPNDPAFAMQWAHQNTGQPVPAQTAPGAPLGPPVAGTPKADDGAAAAWGNSNGSLSVGIDDVEPAGAY